MTAFNPKAICSEYGFTIILKCECNKKKNDLYSVIERTQRKNKVLSLVGKPCHLERHNDSKKSLIHSLVAFHHEKQES